MAFIVEHYFEKHGDLHNKQTFDYAALIEPTC